MPGVARTRGVRRLAMAAVVALLVSLMMGAAPRPDATHRCVPTPFEVTLSNGRQAQVAAWLCWRGPRPGPAVQVAVPGTTYTHAYWDWPYQPQVYSYARYMTGEGWAVLLYDRVGTGASTIPGDFAQVTFDLHVRTLHRAVTGLREGWLTGHAFDTVVTTGHSQGAFIADVEAAQYQDVDAVVSTAILHGVNPLVGPHAKNLFSPAFLDPTWGDRAPPGYATTPPGTRGPAFYHPPNADPAVIALDDQTKSIASYAELTMATALRPYTGLEAPVLSIVGNRDALFCLLADCSLNAQLGIESLSWPDARCFDLVFLPETGHDLNLHRTAPAQYALTADWLDRVLSGSC